MSLPITLDVEAVSKLLFCGTNTVLNLTKRGELPHAKFGRNYVYVTEDIVNCIRSRYPIPQQVVQGDDKEKLCQSLSVKTHRTTTLSSNSTESEYTKALGLPTKQKQNKRRQN